MWRTTPRWSWMPKAACSPSTSPRTGCLPARKSAPMRRTCWLSRTPPARWWEPSLHRPSQDARGDPAAPLSGHELRAAAAGRRGADLRGRIPARGRAAMRTGRGGATVVIPALTTTATMVQLAMKRSYIEIAYASCRAVCFVAAGVRRGSTDPQRQRLDAHAIRWRRRRLDRLAAQFQSESLARRMAVEHQTIADAHWHFGSLQRRVDRRRRGQQVAACMARLTRVGRRRRA